MNGKCVDCSVPMRANKVCRTCKKKRRKGPGKEKQIETLKQKVALLEQRLGLKPSKPVAVGFYDSREWQELRYKVIKAHGRKCMACGISNVEVHVDHIKPRSKHPELALEYSNLQVLCRPCNMGKSNKDDTDWRPSI